MAKYDKATKEAMAAQIEEHAKGWWFKAVRDFGDKIGKFPEVRMNARLTSTAGRAFIDSKPPYTDFSCYLFEKYPEGFINRTIPHELAHHIAWRLYKDGGHGKTWKAVALKLYGDNSRCHTYETKHEADKKAAQGRKNVKR